MPRRRAAHRAAPVPIGAGLRALAAGVGVMTLAVTVALGGVAGSYAYLSDRQTVPLRAGGVTTANITAGSATLTASPSTLTLSNLYPGDVRTTDVTITNTGVTSLALSLTSITGVTVESALVATVAPGTCASNGTGVTSGSLGVTLASAGVTTVCLRVSMPVGAATTAQDKSTTIIATVRGVQP